MNCAISFVSWTRCFVFLVGLLALFVAGPLLPSTWATPTVMPTATPTPTPTATPTATPTPRLKIYEGSLSLHYFGNDATTGVTPPFNAYVFTALPLGARCNPAVSGGMTCDPTATLQVGAPLTGNGTASVAGGSPASIMLPSSQLGRITSGSFPPRYAYQIYQKTYANLANAAGGFQPGGGPGLVSYYPTSQATGVRIFPGKNQFGGVMRLLKGTPSGGLGTKGRVYFTGHGSYVYNVPSWGVTFVGATSNGGSPAVGAVTAFWRTTWTYLSSSGRVLGWPWTTGKVSVRATGDYLAYPFWFPEYLTRAGYDNRTSQGGGTIQLVTPHLTLWGGKKFGAIGVLRLEFVPEPRGVLVLVAGTAFLGLLYRRRVQESPRCR